MVTMREHPKHGRHPATGNEVEVLKASGWTVMPPKNKRQEVVVEVVVQQEPEQRQKRKYTKRMV